MTTARNAPENRVDVGIPTYGRPAFLAEAIESVLAQSFSDWRLTISENGPGSDAVARIVEPHLSDPRVRYVTTGRNIGAAGNSTSLIQDGVAQYVAVLHDDDLWLPTFLARRVAFLDEQPGCGLVFSASDFIDDHSNVLYRFEVDLAEGVQDRKAFLRRLYVGNVIGMPTVLVRRTAYEAVGPVFNDALFFHDFEMWLRIASRFEVGFVSGCDARYRVHPSQTTRSLRGHVGEHQLQTLEEVDRFLPAEVSRLMRRRARFVALIRSFVDALARRELRQSAAYLVRALRVYPVGPFDPKVARRVIGRLRLRGRDRTFWGAGLDRSDRR